LRYKYGQTKGGDLVEREQAQHNRESRVSALFSPAALRIELLGIVALVLILGRISPDFGKLLLQFSRTFFR